MPIHAVASLPLEAQTGTSPAHAPYGTRPRLSVIMPVFNSQKHLRQALASVLEQDLESLQIICINDGSTDKSATILKDAAAQDRRIVVIEQPNAGAAAARNRGIEQAEGDYLCFMDADDRYPSASSLRLLYEAAQRDGQPIAGGSFVNYRGKGKLEDVFDDPTYAGYTFRSSNVVRYAEYQYEFGFHRFIFSKELFGNGANRFPLLSYYEDPVFLARILHEGLSFSAVAEPTYLYRCDAKPIRWTTDKVLDLLEGVRLNFLFSSKHGYERLHWYTARHFDEASWYCGTGIEPQLSIAAIEPKLRETEQAIHHELLASVDPNDANFIPLMRKRIERSMSSPPLQRLVDIAAFRLKKNLAPAFHRFKS